MMSEKQIALVTGANKGIGRVVVKGLAELGYTVYLGSRSEQLGHEAKEAIGRSELDIRVIQLDVTSPVSIAAAVSRIDKEIGHLDTLVNNAGINPNLLPASKCDKQTLLETYDVNLFGPIMVTQLMLPLLRAGRGKTIANISSDLGSLSLHSYPEFPYAAADMLAYCSSKSALNAFTVLLAKELRGEGFKINAVNPGFTATDLNAFTGSRTPEEAAKVIVQYASLGEDGPTGGYFAEGGTLPW
ncbi:SDR family oxidoreductase [Rhizobium calliandrae]|uniref:SDR family oxidoreductase n=1 Tax=Rhizobium calliandrae TaxID=1312182 RepID=A0ABT7KQZ6_9HYPH|nr:SDR family oxidoreductase [Rhizobium calliandrae]MDL2410537.1 SDR family oxidoreductase [Rhizobium calliandrae]